MPDSALQALWQGYLGQDRRINSTYHLYTAIHVVHKAIKLQKNVAAEFEKLGQNDRQLIMQHLHYNVLDLGNEFETGKNNVLHKCSGCNLDGPRSDVNKR